MPKREKQYSKYYIPFVPNAKVDYTVLFLLYDLADYNKVSKCYDKIQYTSVAALAEQLSISESKLKRIMKSADYAHFIRVDKPNKTIFLRNNFVEGSTKRPFVCLSLDEV